MRPFAALSIALLATCASASTITIPLMKLQRSGSNLNGSHANRARAAFLKSRAASGPTTVPATNLAYVQYTTSVGIGSPPTYYNLVVDAASSNTFCGTGTPYVRTSTSIPTGQSVSDIFASANFSGPQYLDQVTLAPNLVIANQSIVDAHSFTGFDGIDGILGVGPVDLTQGTLTSDANAMTPTIMDNLVSQGLIKHKVLGVHFAPATNSDDTNGALTYGGVDSSLFEGKLTYTPVTNTYPASIYWSINITSSTYGNHIIIPSSTAGIVDTGTTQVLLADDFFASYMDAIPGAKLDSNAGLIEIPPHSALTLQPLHFVIADRVFSMDATAQLLPKEQNTAWGGTVGKQYGVIGNTGSPSGEGMDFVIGLGFLERHYVVFDGHANRIGFARTKNTST